MKKLITTLFLLILVGCSSTQRNTGDAEVQIKKSEVSAAYEVVKMIVTDVKKGGHDITAKTIASYKGFLKPGETFNFEYFSKSEGSVPKVGEKYISTFDVENYKMKLNKSNLHSPYSEELAQKMKSGN